MPRKARNLARPTPPVPQGAQAVAPAGPGAASTRQDLAKPQPVATPTGMGYGEAQALAQAQKTVPLPQGGAPMAPTPQGAPAGPPPALGRPTERPFESVTAPAPLANSPSASLALKVDLLRYISATPFAGPEVQTLLKNAQVEYDNAQHAKFIPPSVTAPVGALASPEPPAPMALPEMPVESPAEAPMAPPQEMMGGL